MKPMLLLVAVVTSGALVPTPASKTPTASVPSTASIIQSNRAAAANSDRPSTGAVISATKDILNAAFFVVVGTVTILTYRRAKKTVLQPIKTEIFKQQIVLFSEVLKLFVGKTEVELREQFAFEKMLLANVHYQWDIYVRLCFGVVNDEAQRPYSRALCRRSSFVFRADETPEPPLDGIMHVAVIPPRWEDHRPREIRVPNEYTAMEATISGVLESPLIPGMLAELLSSYLEVAHSNIDALRETLAEYNMRLPQICPTFEERRNLSSTLPHHMFAQRFRELKPAADKIIAYIREYFSVEQLMSTE